MITSIKCMQKLWLLFLLPVLWSCASTPVVQINTEYPDIRSFSLPVNVQLVLVPPMKSEEASNTYALYEAACRIAMKQKLFVFSGQVSHVTGTGERIHDDFSYHYDDSNIETIQAALQIIDCQILPDEQRRYLVQNPAESEQLRCITYNLDPSYFVVTESGRPQWVITPPSNGVLSSYGTVAMHRTYADAVFAADLAAACALIRQSDSTIRNYALNYNSSEALSVIQHRQGGVSLASGTVSGFYVIDRWIDPRNGDVYTLAVCNSVQKRSD